MTKIKDFIKNWKTVSYKIAEIEKLNNFSRKHLNEEMPIYFHGGKLLLACCLIGIFTVMCFHAGYTYILQHFYERPLVFLDEIIAGLYFVIVVIVVVTGVVRLVFDGQETKTIPVASKGIALLDSETQKYYQKVAQFSEQLQQHSNLVERLEVLQAEFITMGADNSSITVRKKLDNLKVEIKLNLLYDLLDEDSCEELQKLLELLEQSMKSTN